MYNRRAPARADLRAGRRPPQPRAAPSRCRTAPPPGRLRLGRLPPVPRARARARRLRRAARRTGPRPRRGPPARIGLACRRRAERPRTLATSRSSERRGARRGAPEERQRRGRDDRDGSARRRHPAHHDHAAGPGPPHRRGQGCGDASGSSPNRSTCARDADTAANPGPSRLATTRAARAIGASAVHLAATGWPTACSRSRADCSAATAARSSSPAARRASAGTRAAASPPQARGARRLASERPHGRGRRGTRLTGHYTLPIARPTRRRVNSSACYGYRGRCLRRRDRPRTAELSVRDYVTVHDAGRLLNRCSPRARSAAASRTASARALLEEHRYDEDGNLMTGIVPDYCRRPRPSSRASSRSTSRSPSPLTPLGAKASARADHERPAAIAKRRRRRARIDAIELPRRRSGSGAAA